MRYLLSLIILCFFSCNNERVLQLSEIKNADVTEVLDVSPAYLFYDEAQADIAWERTTAFFKKHLSWYPQDASRGVSSLFLHLLNPE